MKLYINLLIVFILGTSCSTFKNKVEQKKTFTNSLIVPCSYNL